MEVRAGNMLRQFTGEKLYSLCPNLCDAFHFLRFNQFKLYQEFAHGIFNFF